MSPETIAAAVNAAIAKQRQISPFSAARASCENPYRVTALLRSAFEAAGGSVTGFKVGFTNRDMWDAYGVTTPIWGYCTSRTTCELEAMPVVRVRDFVEPRIEPEIVFGLAASVSPEMDERELLDCIEWVALGYEIVQSIYPNWNFTASDAILANGLHGSLLIGSRRAISPRKAAWQNELATFRAELCRGGELSQRGGGALVLGSPLQAVRHLAELLANDPHNPPLRGGEIVSTGTLTLAMPIAAGETWTTRVDGIALDNITLRIEA